MIPVARLGDLISTTATIIVGAGTVFADNLPVVTIGAATSPFPPGYLPSTIIVGSGTVFAENKPMVRMGDAVAPAISIGPPYTPLPPPLPGVVAVGSGTVFAG